MVIFRNIILICWAIFLFYWFVNWTNVKPSQNRRLGMSWLRWSWILVVGVILFSSKKFGLELNFTQDNFFPFIKIFGVTVAVIGLIIAIIARKTLAGNWSATIDLKKNHTLITSGIYRYIRHPIYTGVSFMSLGTLLVLPSLVTLLSKRRDSYDKDVS